MTTTVDQLADLRASGLRLRQARDHQASALASHAWDLWLAVWHQAASRNKIVAASALAHQAAWDVLALGDDAQAAYADLRAAGVPTDQAPPATTRAAGLEVSLRPLSTRRILVSLDAVPSHRPGGDARDVWSWTLAALRGGGWQPREVDRPDDPDAGFWPQATIGRRPPQEWEPRTADELGRAETPADILPPEELS